jgi:hypothetical protein
MFSFGAKIRVSVLRRSRIGGVVALRRFAAGAAIEMKKGGRNIPQPDEKAFGPLGVLREKLAELLAKPVRVVSTEFFVGT